MNSKRKLTPLQKRLRKKYTHAHRATGASLMVPEDVYGGQQAFRILGPDDKEGINFFRDMLAIALSRIIDKETRPL